MANEIELKPGTRTSLRKLLFGGLLLLISAVSLSAQTTSFTYQGRLTDGGTAANGSYDLQFVLFDSSSGGSQIGTQTVSTVAVSAGVFTVQLDFGPAAFPGTNRWLEISARLTGAPAFTLLTPRQQITSTPYAIRRLNASTADTVVVGGVPSGSGNYIQNTNTTQAGANFNIAGNGSIGGNLTVAGTLSLNIVNANTQYNLAGNRIITAPGTGNLVVGPNAGASGLTGVDNTVVGNSAANASTAGDANSIFGVSAGFNNQGSGNSFFGRSAGLQSTTGSNNSFFGRQAGRDNTTGSENSFFGFQAGIGNHVGIGNSFFGYEAGRDNCFPCVNPGQGSNNSFFGKQSGRANTLGFNNAFFGYQAGFSNLTGSSNSIFGVLAGTQATAADQNSLFGSTSGQVTTGAQNAFFGASSGLNNRAGANNTFIGYVAGWFNTTGSSNTALGSRSDMGSENLSFATAVGANAIVTASNKVQLGRFNFDVVAIGRFSTPATSVPVCTNAANEFVSCQSSSRRYKEAIQPFQTGLSLVQRLRPVTFNWKTDHKRDVGLIAEEVADVEPLLSTRNDAGEVEGVRYTQLTLVLINAVKEQQAQIQMLRRTNAALNARLESVERTLRRAHSKRRRW